VKKKRKWGDELKGKAVGYRLRARPAKSGEVEATRRWQAIRK